MNEPKKHSPFIKFITVFLALTFMTAAWFKREPIKEEITLEQLIRYSSCVVIADKNLLNVTQKILKVGNHCDPFVRNTYLFKITDILYSKENLPVGKEIGVLPANWEKELHNQRMCCNQGVCVSPHYPSYLSSADFEKSGKFILFLKTMDYETFSFTLENAYERVSKRYRVEDIIEAWLQPELQQDYPESY